MERKRWIPEDVAKLQSMAGKFPTPYIARELGRGLCAVVVKAHSLQISLGIKQKRRSMVGLNGHSGPSFILLERAFNSPRAEVRLERRARGTDV